MSISGHALLLLCCTVGFVMSDDGAVCDGAAYQVALGNSSTTVDNMFEAVANNSVACHSLRCLMRGSDACTGAQTLSASECLRVLAQLHVTVRLCLCLITRAAQTCLRVY